MQTPFAPQRYVIWIYGTINTKSIRGTGVITDKDTEKCKYRIMNTIWGYFFFEDCFPFLMLMVH